MPHAAAGASVAPACAAHRPVRRHAVPVAACAIPAGRTAAVRGPLRPSHGRTCQERSSPAQERWREHGRNGTNERQGAVDDVASRQTSAKRATGQVRGQRPSRGGAHERIRIEIVSNFPADAALTLRKKRGFSVCSIAGSRSRDYRSNPHFNVELLMTQDRPPEHLRTACRLSRSAHGGHPSYTSRIRAMSSRSSLPVFTIPCVSPSGQTVTSPAATRHSVPLSS